MPAGAVGVPQIIPLRPPKGCRRHVIDSTTEIELVSESQESLIYYTLNGKQPDPFQSAAKKYTFLYKEPFTVSAGKVTLKALAVSQDGTRQSHIASRTFTVHQGVFGSSTYVTKQTSKWEPAPTLSQKFRESLQITSREEIKSAIAEAFDASLTIPLSTSPDKRSMPSYTRPASVLLSPKVPSCLHCLTPRASDGSDKFCTQCGAELPTLPVAQDLVDAGRSPVCPGCRAVLPGGTQQCVVCDSEVPPPDPIPRIRAQVNTDSSIMKDGGLCLECGTANPGHLTECVTCGSSLSPAAATRHASSGPPQLSPSPAHTTAMNPIVGSSYIMCGTCGRVNVSDARYCDWCGSKPEDSRDMLNCHSCFAANKWQARFCHTCGTLVKCPLRPNVELAPTLHMTANSIEPNRWIPVTDRVVPKDDKGINVKPSVVSTSTQTQGLFYPSAKTIANKQQMETSKLLIKSASQDRTQHLPEFSPGKGLWRTQLDHICSHLRTHSQCSPDFQDEIGWKEIGKLVSANLKESDQEENSEHTLLLNLVFALKGSPNSSTTAPRYSTHMIGARRKSTSTSLGERRVSSAGTRRKKPLVNKQLTRRSSSLTGIKAEDHLLAVELGSEGQGRADIVENLIEKGADPNHVNQRGQFLLSLAASHGHTDSIDALLNHGARLDSQDKRTGNTPLHEATLKGPSHRDIIELLLKRGASTSVKNKDGLTVFEIATRHHYSELVKLFTAHLGSSMLHT